MISISILSLFFLSGLLTLLMLCIYIYVTRKFHFYEVPNARSSHKKPVLTGGGWPILLVSQIIFCFFTPEFEQSSVVLCAVTLVLAIMSWIDDLSPLSPTVRLVIQSIAVAFMLSLIPAVKPILFDGLPWQIDRLIVACGWLWFINLYNFMDGVDGLAAIETISICIGIVVVGYVVGLNENWLLLSILLSGAALGFLFFNWYPAKIIMGDVGSISLGFLIGWILIQLSLKGYVFSALILPIYFLADATLTLVKRIANGEKFWTPHKKHFYQIPVVAGHPHSLVVKWVIAGNIFIAACAVAAIYAPLLSSIVACPTSAPMEHFEVFA